MAPLVRSRLNNRFLGCLARATRLPVSKSLQAKTEHFALQSYQINDWRTLQFMDRQAPFPDREP